MAKKQAIQANLVRGKNDTHYTPMESWEVIALGDRIQIETARVVKNLHMTFYVRKD